ncbi:MAG: aminotransferase DegT [Streptosporangiales bacterium]|nr:aminotransferase DegT [Streptosporangiales bacterium]
MDADAIVECGQHSYLSGVDRDWSGVIVSDPFVVPYRPVGSLFGQEELDAVARVLASGQTLSCGQERDAFEQEFASYTGAPHAISVTNCTVALELASYLAGVREGCEVIATTQTYQATVAHLLGRGITVRFADIDPKTLNVDPESVSRLVSARTNAIYLVHHGGLSADMDAVLDVAKDRGIRVIEDCAHSLGGTYHGRHPGTLGDIGCFSFQSYKNVSTLGEGGMVTLNDDELADVLRRVIAIEPDADFAGRPSRSIGGHVYPDRRLDWHAKNSFDQDCLALRHGGTNSTLAEPAAAVGRVQLGRIEEFLARRRRIAEWLDAQFRDVARLRLPTVAEGVSSAHHLYTCFVRPGPGRTRDEIATELLDRGIQVQLRYFPLHMLPEWRREGHEHGECPVAERVWFEELLQLPIYPQMQDWQVEYLASAVRDALE